MSAVEFILYPNTRLEIHYKVTCVVKMVLRKMRALLVLLGVYRHSLRPYFTERHSDFAPEYVYVVRLVVIIP